MDRRSLVALSAGSGLLAASASLLPPHAFAQSLRLTGAGASFPFPLFDLVPGHGQANSTCRSTTSRPAAALVKSLIARTVDFAASDAAMTDEQIAEVDGGVVLLPMTAGEVVLAYNLPGVTELKLPARFTR